LKPGDVIEMGEMQLEFLSGAAGPAGAGEARPQ
jgi:hypothetical protein